MDDIFNMVGKEKYMPIVNFSITLRNMQIGYTIDMRDNGSLWLENTDNEGMELTEELKDKLLELLDKFYKEHF